MWQALALRMASPIEELQQRMSHREFVYWCSVYESRPFDDERCFDLGPALIRNDMRVLAGSGKRTKVSELMPYRKESPEQSLVNSEFFKD